MASIPLVITEPHSCSYLDTQQAQLAFVNPNFSLNNRLYSQLIQYGFRRSGNEVYHPHCQDCQQCISSRIDIHQFKPNRSQKRCYKKNKDTEVIVKPATFDPNHYALYQLYQQYKHPDSSMLNSSPEEYIHFLSSSWCQAQFIEFHIKGQLAAVAIVDFLDHALSAVYTFFAPEFAQYSLGRYAVLWQIEEAKRLELDWVYLGFWVADCQKMAYKTQYQPLEGYVNKSWVSLHPEKTKTTE